MKKLLSIILTVVLAVGCVSGLSLAISADDEPYFKFYQEISEIGADGITLWAGGGKETLENGTVEQRNSVQVTVYENYKGNGYINATNTKQVQWIATDSPVAPSFGTKSNSSCITVSKGKVTAKAAGTAYVYAVRKDPTNEDLEVADYFTVTVKNAATAFSLCDANGEKYKKVELSLGTTVEVFVEPTVKKGEPDPESSFTATIPDKCKDYIAFWNGVELVQSVSMTGFTKPFTIVGTGIDAIKKKVATANILVTCGETGKSQTLSFTVKNDVVGKIASVPTAEVVASKKTVESTTITAETIKSYLVYSSTKNADALASYGMTAEEIAALTTTDISPKIYLTKTAPTSVDEVIVNNKIVFKVGKDDKVTNFTAKFNKDKDLVISAKKSAETGSGFIVLIYNVFNGENGYLVIPVTVMQES